MSTDTKELKWDRRKKSGYAPSIRSGCTMALWANKDIGILFGGVKDDDQSEESLVSEFYNDLSVNCRLEDNRERLNDVVTDTHIIPLVMADGLV